MPYPVPLPVYDAVGQTPGSVIDAALPNSHSTWLGHATRGRYYPQENQATGDGVTDDSAAFLAADTANGGKGVTTVAPVPNGYRLAAATTLAHALTLPFGAILKPDSGVTVTINGNLDAGPYQIFGGAGTVQVPNAEHARPEWWGAKADWNGTTGTDNRVAFDKMLASGCKNFRLMPGNYAVKTADASGNGITLSAIAMQLHGAGYGLTTLTILCPVTWGVKAAVAQVKCSDFTLVVGSGGTATYAVGVSTASVGSAESCAFRDILEGVADTGTIANGFAVGPDNPGSSTMDIAETSFLRCRANGPHTNAGFLIGNGTAGNVLETWLTHCTALNGVYGLYANRTSFSWRDGTMGSNSGYDFEIQPFGGGVISVDGCRSELSAAFWNAEATVSAAVNVGLSNVQYFGTAMAASGIWFRHAAAGHLAIHNLTCSSTGAVTPSMELISGGPLVTTIDGITYPGPMSDILTAGAGAGSITTVAGFLQTDATSSQIVVGTAPFTVLGSGAQISAGTIGSGFRAKEGSNGKQGTATLAAGTVTVANTSVTANSRVFLTAQDGNTTGALRVSARTAGTSFTITSSNSGDTGVVAYEIFEPA